MASFGTDARSKVLVSKDCEIGSDDCLFLESVVDRYVKYFKCVFHRNTWYYAYFFVCELMNYILLVVQFQYTDKILNGKFLWYGLEAWVYLSSGKNHKDGALNPMCAAFPTEVSCELPTVGAAGGEQSHNGLCVLTQNIINEKIYLILWFWYVILGTISAIFFIFRLLTIMSSDVRFWMIYKVVRHEYDEDLPKHLKKILEKSQIGDWFVIYQLSKNSNPYFFRDFIRSLSRNLEQKPKQSLSGSSNKSNKKQQQANNNILALMNRLSPNKNSSKRKTSQQNGLLSTSTGSQSSLSQSVTTTTRNSVSDVGSVKIRMSELVRDDTFESAASRNTTNTTNTNNNNLSVSATNASKERLSSLLSNPRLSSSSEDSE